MFCIGLQCSSVFWALSKVANVWCRSHTLQLCIDTIYACQQRSNRACRGLQDLQQAGTALLEALQDRPRQEITGSIFERFLQTQARP